MELSVVREIEEVSARAWPPLEQRDVDGWVLRAGGGVTGRANSVWPRAEHGGLPLDEKLAAAGEFYAERELPLLIQLAPTARPVGLADELISRGYGIARAARTVQVAELDGVVAVGDASRADISGVVSGTWYDVVAQVNSSFEQHRRAARALLDGVAQPSAFALVTLDGAPAAAGRGVSDGDWLGVFNMATLPAYRRQGCAAAVLAALAVWARDHGAKRAYLQMDGDNTAAPALYARAGFTPCYEYAFWGKTYPTRPTVCRP
ncbi:MAG: GNAT family N-acetyltransferase [Mycobacteriales bacterium]